MSAYQPLFSIEVVHAYFREPSACRLQFTPDAATVGWLAASGCVMRQRPNGLTLYFEASASSTTRRPRRTPAGEPARLSFTARALDPLFGFYSDGLAPTAPDAPLLVFDSAQAKPSNLAEKRWSLKARAVAGAGGLDGQPAFGVVIGLTGDLSDAGRAYQIDLQSRAVVWKYLLVGDWAGDRPCVIDAEQPAQIAFADPFEDLGKAPSVERLANGQMAIPVRSTAPIALADWPTRKHQLWSRSETGARDRMLASALPCAAAANFAVETAGDPSSLVAEIFVSR